MSITGVVCTSLRTYLRFGADSAVPACDGGLLMPNRGDEFYRFVFDLRDLQGLRKSCCGGS